MFFLKHIQRAYYQCYMPVNSARNASVFLDPLCYGYYLDDEKLVSDLTYLELSVAFNLPCTCQKCARYAVSPCTVKSIGCCKYSKCVTTETVVLP